jgi:hypothetical protein
VPKKRLFKIGLATAAAAVAAIMAITVAFAHGTPTTTGRSMVGTIVNAATGASLVSFQDAAPNAISDEQAQDQLEDSLEKTNGTESASEDSAEQAADKTEDASEVKCAPAVGGENHSAGDSKESSTKTFSSKGDH